MRTQIKNLFFPACAVSLGHVGTCLANTLASQAIADRQSYDDAGNSIGISCLSSSDSMICSVTLMK